MDHIQKITPEAMQAWMEYEPAPSALESAQAGKTSALLGLLRHAFHSGFIAAKKVDQEPEQ